MRAAQATWNPERDLWETDSMDLFSGLSDVFSETLPISGMTRSGRLFLRPQSVPLTVGNESSSSRGQLFRAPCAAEAEGGPRDPNRPGVTMRLSDQVREETEAGNLLPTPRATQGGSATETVDLLPTPAANLATSGPDYARAERDGSGGNDLCTAVHLLPTPRASDGEKGGPNQRGSKGDLTVSSAVHLLPTPLAGDADNGNVNHPESRRSQGRSVGMQNVAPTIVAGFGPYADAIARWETVTGREAPAPTELSPKGKHRLSARFVEWMMGQSDGWVTDEELGLSRVQQLRALGNGVVTQQAVFAINWLLGRAQDQRRKAA